MVARPARIEPVRRGHRHGRFRTPLHFQCAASDRPLTRLRCYCVQRILDAAEAFGARVIFTDPACFTGTDRVAQAVSILQREQVI